MMTVIQSAEKRFQRRGTVTPPHSIKIFTGVRSTDVKVRDAFAQESVKVFIKFGVRASADW